MLVRRTILIPLYICLLSFLPLQSQTAINIGNRMELFVDNYLIDNLVNMEIKLHKPERREIVFKGETEWENKGMFFYRVLKDSNKIRLYYRASMTEKDNERVPVIALAESYDNGFTFTRPTLNLVDYNGSTENNILFIGDTPNVPPPFIDTNPDCKPEEKYKGLSGEWKRCFIMGSPDGIHWKPITKDTLDMEGTFDTINTSFWDPQIKAYRCFTRYFENLKPDSNEEDVLGAKPTVVRAIQSSTSRDFFNWTKVEHNKYNDDYGFQMYTNATLPCPGAGHIYLAFPNRYVQERITDADHPYPGINDALFMSSRDAVHWNRFPEAWIRPGLDEKNWTDRNNYPTWGIVESSETEWSMYVSEHYRHPLVKPQLRRLSIRPHGFCSIHADYKTGQCLTKPFIFSGSHLIINFSTSAIGSVQIEIQDAAGNAIPGFELGNMTPMFGDKLAQKVEWQNGSDLSKLVGKEIRLLFVMSDADVFAIQFSD